MIRSAYGLPLWVRARTELMPLVAVLVVLVLVYLRFYPSLFTLSSIDSLSVQFLPLILATMAQAVVMLTGGIDLSLGAALGLAVAIIATRAGTTTGTALEAVLITLMVGLVVGALTGSLVSYAKLPSIIVTLATSFVWGGVTLFILPQPGGQVPQPWVQVYNGYSSDAPTALAIIVVTLLLWTFIKSTRFGMNIYAAGDNEHGAFTSGVNVRLVRAGAYALAGFFTALAGVGVAIETGSGDPNIGTPYTLNSITAAVLGGISFFGGVGEMKGAVIGALVLGFLLNILTFSGISSFYQYILQGVVLIAAISLKALAMSRKD